MKVLQADVSPYLPSQAHQGGMLRACDGLARATALVPSCIPFADHRLLQHVSIQLNIHGRLGHTLSPVKDWNSLQSFVIAPLAYALL